MLFIVIIAWVLKVSCALSTSQACLKFLFEYLGVQNEFSYTLVSRQHFDGIILSKLYLFCSSLIILDQLRLDSTRTVRCRDVILHRSVPWSYSKCHPLA